MLPLPCTFFFFFFNDTATTEIYTLSLHDALPISIRLCPATPACASSTAPSSSTVEPAMPDCATRMQRWPIRQLCPICTRSEEHTSELQSLRHLVCRLLLEKKKKNLVT